MSCLSVRKEQLGSQWADFHGIWYLSIFGKPVEKKLTFQYNLKTIMDNLREDVCTFMTASG